jgi:hypothetical protein
MTKKLKYRHIKLRKIYKKLRAPIDKQSLSTGKQTLFAKPAKKA